MSTLVTRTQWKSFRETIRKYNRRKTKVDEKQGSKAQNEMSPHKLAFEAQSNEQRKTTVLGHFSCIEVGVSISLFFSGTSKADVMKIATV